MIKNYWLRSRAYSRDFWSVSTLFAMDIHVHYIYLSRALIHHSTDICIFKTFGMDYLLIKWHIFSPVVSVDETRVVLEEIEGEPGSNYINANYIQVSNISMAEWLPVASLPESSKNHMTPHPQFLIETDLWYVALIYKQLGSAPDA